MKLFFKGRTRGKERIKRLIALLLTVLVIFNSMGLEYILAVGNKDELRLAVENRLSEFTSKTLSQYGGYLGVFYNMDKILTQSIWLDFVQKDLDKKDKGLEIDVATVNHYKEDLIDFVEQFNEAYGEGDSSKEGEVAKFKFDLDWFRDDINLFAISNAYADYIREYMDTAIPDKSASDEDILKKNKKIFSNIYDIIDNTVNTVKSANSLIPYKDEPLKNGAVKRTPNYEYKLADNIFQKLYSILDPYKTPEQQDKDQIPRLLRKSKELSEKDLDSATPDSIDNTLNLLDRFYQGGTFLDKI